MLMYEGCVLKCLLDTKTKASFKVLPFLLRTPMKRAQKTARLSPLAALRQMWTEIEVSDGIFPVPLLLYIALLIIMSVHSIFILFK